MNLAFKTRNLQTCPCNFSYFIFLTITLITSDVLCKSYPDKSWDWWALWNLSWCDFPLLKITSLRVRFYQLAFCHQKQKRKELIKMNKRYIKHQHATKSSIFKIRVLANFRKKLKLLSMHLLFIKMSCKQK